MAIFTKAANYLKCRNYFEKILGFDITNIESEPGFSEYGLLCTDHNLRIAQNIWFLYGGALAWNEYQIDPEDPLKPVYGEDNPPMEDEVGFTLHNTDDFVTTDRCGFIIDTTSVTNKYFIGMKRLVPLEGVALNKYQPALTKNEIKTNYKNIIQFIDTREETKGQPLSPTNDTLNTAMPNEIKITTSYDYGDFDVVNNREYDVRQIGMLNHLHCPSQNEKIIISNYNTLYNGISIPEDSTNITTLADIFTLSELSNVLPINFNPWDYGEDPEEEDWTKITTTGFFGVLQFFLNSRANNRITYQTDYYNFILRFENKLKCSCTCEDCECNS